MLVLKLTNCRLINARLRLYQSITASVPAGEPSNNLLQNCITVEAALLKQTFAHDAKALVRASEKKWLVLAELEAH